jgi:hypothetical protein
MFINHAKFRENGSSGYNLQPDVKDPQTPISLTVCVLGARNLPQRSKIDILDP